MDTDREVLKFRFWASGAGLWLLGRTGGDGDFLGRVLTRCFFEGG
jgi:hypothetical protein